MLLLLVYFNRSLSITTLPRSILNPVSLTARLSEIVLSVLDAPVACN